MSDPFGISKKDDKKKRAEHYGRMSGALGAVGVGAGSVGAGAGVVGRMESKGKDPMGFTARTDPYKRPVSGAVKNRALKPFAAAHRYQSKTLGGLAAGSLALSAGYHHKKKKTLAKADRKKSQFGRKASDTAMAGASAGVAGAALHHGGKNANMLNRQAKIYEGEARASHHLLSAQKTGHVEMDAGETKFHRAQRKTGIRVSSVKRPAGLAAAGAAAAGGAALYEMGRYGSSKLKRKKVSKALTLTLPTMKGNN